MSRESKLKLRKREISSVAIYLAASASLRKDSSSCTVLTDFSSGRSWVDSAMAFGTRVDRSLRGENCFD